MSGLQLALGENALAAFLLAVARVGGFVLVSPPFATRAVPARVKSGLAIALALPLAAFLQPTAPRLGSSQIVLQMGVQVFLGVTLGFFVLVAVAAIQAVGDLLDLVGGFSLSIAMDPLLLVQSSVFGRLHQLVATTLLFVTDGHLMILHGLARSVQVMPTPVVDWEELATAVTRDVAGLLLGALQIAAPIVAAMLVADVGLGLLTRAAPALNAFALSMPVKILFTLLLAGLVVTRLPEALERFVEHAVLTGLDLVGANEGAGVP
jgi:flagellar biosynthetic protein FliR